MNRTGRARRVLLICGIVSSVLYIGTDIAAAMRWRGTYHYASQAFSELMAFEAPTRSFVLSLMIPYNVLLILFGLGVWAAGSGKRPLRVTGILLIASAMVGLVTPSIFPAPMRGVEATARNALHLPLTFVQVVINLSTIAFGAAVSGQWFRLYSIATIVAQLAFGAWAGTYAPRIAANQPTPWLGIIERVNIYSYMLWVVILAIILWRLGATRRRT